MQNRILTTIWTGILLFTAAHAATTNLLATGDFEGATSAWTRYVNTATGATGAATLAFSAAGAHAGSFGALMSVTASDTVNWHIQLKFPQVVLQANTVYQISYWAKGPGPVLLGISDSAYNYLSGFNNALTSTWQQYSGTIVGNGGKRYLSFYVALNTGDYAFDDISLTPIGTLDSTWYSKADARIDSLRKKDFGVQVVAASGAAQANATVSVKLLQHEFPFGTALNFHNDADDSWYKQMAAKYFWAGVNENAFKWEGYEAVKDQPDSASVDAVLDWADSNGFNLMRGHNLEWGITKYSFSSFWARQGTRDEYLAALKHHINRDMAFFKGRFKQYDVWNEAFHEPALFTQYGSDIIDSAYIWARAADPTAKLYLNEYSIVAGGETPTYMNLAQGMQQRKVPLDGVGAQCHFGNQAIDPALINLRLSELGTLGLPVMITEFDIGDNTNGLTLTQAQQASEVSKFLRTAFSHPAVVGITFWGFWDNRHWIPGGGFIDANKVPKIAADSIYNLWHNVWTTNVSGATSAGGVLGFRGFAGKYQVTVTSGATTIIDTLNYNANSLVWTINLGTKTATPILPQQPVHLGMLSAGQVVQIMDIKGHLIWRGTLPQTARGNHLDIPGLQPCLGVINHRMVRINL